MDSLCALIETLRIEPSSSVCERLLNESRSAVDGLKELSASRANMLSIVLPYIVDRARAHELAETEDRISGETQAAFERLVVSYRTLIDNPPRDDAWRESVIADVRRAFALWNRTTIASDALQKFLESSF